MIRQAKGDVNAAPEGGVLEHGQPLVMVHRQHGVTLFASTGGVNMVSAGCGPLKMDPFGSQCVSSTGVMISISSRPR
jgi:hypothetical protein